MKTIHFENSTHSAKEAAIALGCEMDQIVKTLILHDKQYYFIVLLNGDAKLNYSKIKKLLDIGRPSLASPAKVLEISGSQAGGVKPIFRTNLKVIMDEKILKYDKVYGGGGDGNSVTELTPKEIIGGMNPVIWNISE